MKILLTLLTFLAVSCGQQEAVDTRRTTPVPQEPDEITILRNMVLNLQGTVTQINNFVASDFSSCDSGSLPAFETKLCQVAQTATAEQQVTLFGQLQELQSIMQESIYGGDCINDTDAGCPMAGSILDDLANIDVATIESDIAQLQTDVTNLQASVNAINTRLDDFDGSGNSIETVINTIESELISLDSRLDDIENVVNGADYYQWIFIGNDIAGLAAKEPILRTGDKLNIVAYVQSATKNGMGLIAEAGVSGDQTFQTDVKPKVRFRIYDLTTELKVCWDNTDRNSSAANIDTICDSANNFTTPTADCTCE